MAVFANAQKLSEHFLSHGPEFGLATEQEYLVRANAFLAGSKPIGVQECTRRRNRLGDVVRYNPVTEEFGILSQRGQTILTYFRPIPCHAAPPAIMAAGNCHGLQTNQDYFRQECLK